MAGKSVLSLRAATAGGGRSLHGGAAPGHVQGGSLQLALRQRALHASEYGGGWLLLLRHGPGARLGALRGVSSRHGGLGGNRRAAVGT